MEAFEAFEIDCNITVSGISMRDTSKLIINKCKVYNRFYNCITIENIDRFKTVIEIKTYDETDRTKIIDWLINAKKWVIDDRCPGEKYMIYMDRNKPPFYTLKLCSLTYWVHEDCEDYETIAEYESVASYEVIEEVPIIKLPREEMDFSFYTKEPGIYINL